MEKCGCKKKKGAFFMVYIVVPICPGERAFGDIGGGVERLGNGSAARHSEGLGG